MNLNINRSKWHYFQLIPVSWWPFFIACNVFSLFINIVWYLATSYDLSSVIINILVLITIAILWWQDMLREACFGHHTSKVQNNLRLGMLLFIVSEIMLFFPFFWSFFANAFSPAIEIYCQWPPIGINTVNPYGLALLGTMVLLSSGFSITVAHYNILSADYKNFLIYMLITISLGVIFLSIQLYEYKVNQFDISDSVYGSCFYVLTGLHGMHVFIGTSFIVYCFLISKQYNPMEHVSFELCSWYWHFVDVVWLLLYISIYLCNGLLY